MARNFCVLPQWFSEEFAMDCSRHKHLSLREVREQELAGEIEEFDVHPVTKRARYVLRNYRWSPAAIPDEVVRRAAGEWRNSPDEVGRARRHVEEYARVATQTRTVFLPAVSFDDEDVWFGRRNAKGRHQVRVTLKQQTPAAKDAALAFYKSRWPDPEKARFPLSMLDTVYDHFRAALASLEQAWPEIVVEFSAGPWSEQMNSLRPGQLPSEILRKVLRAYLNL